MRQVQKFRIDSSEIQGPGSYVIVTMPKWGAFRAAINLQDAEAMQYSTELLQNTVLEWNWTDDHDQTLPSPADQPDVIDDLTVGEVRWLVEAITNAGVDVKN